MVLINGFLYYKALSYMVTFRTTHQILPAMTILRLAIFLSILSSLLLLGGPVVGKPNGLTIKLIHRDSPASPLYPGNITLIERIQRLVNQSKARASFLSSMISANTDQTNGSQSIHPNEAFRAPIAIQAMSTYMVRLGIGTFNATFPARPFKTYHLHMDTGSALTWIQCQDCELPGNHCFPCREPPFPKTISRSYRALPCNMHPLCAPHQCIGNSCSYQEKYMDGAATTGILSQESFTFVSSSGRPQTLLNIVFGCSIDSTDMRYGDDDNQVSGIFGLGWGIRSFVNQISHQSLYDGTFSYCLKFNDGRALDTYLRFGPGISQPTTGLQTTKLDQFKSSAPYYIDLIGISINGTRLSINPALFLLQFDGSGGCIIDSGTTFTSIIRPAFDVVIRTFLLYFSSLPNMTRSRLFEGFFDLCYERSVPEGFRDLPGMTFHLSNADLEVRPEGAFFVKPLNSGKEVFCLAIVADDHYTSLGAYQQTNQKFIYDIPRKQLQFALADCAQDA
jgi:hypothetical protein